MDLCGDAQKSGLILIAMIHARNHADTGSAGTFRQSGGRWCESLGWQGVSDDGNLVGGKTGGEEAIGGSLRVADYRIAPAKSSGLSAELGGAQQVSELAMAADNDGHAGKFGGWNQREIGVEIEGVGDLHMMVAQMAAQVKARTQRLPSEKAAAERKFWSVWEVRSERATAADASQMSLELRRSEILCEYGELALGASGFKSIDHEKQADRRTGEIGWRTCGQAGSFGGSHPVILLPERRLAVLNWAPYVESRQPPGARRVPRA